MFEYLPELKITITYPSTSHLCVSASNMPMLAERVPTYLDLQIHLKMKLFN